jgi:hypothetical protein
MPCGWFLFPDHMPLAPDNPGGGGGEMVRPGQDVARFTAYLQTIIAVTLR